MLHVVIHHAIIKNNEYQLINENTNQTGDSAQTDHLIPDLK